MIPVVLFSSFGFTIDVHYCKGEVKSIGLFGKAQPCEMAGLSDQIDASLPPCHQKKLKEKTKKSNNKDGTIRSNCCYNQTFVFESNEEVEQNDLQISASDVQVVMMACILCDYSFFIHEISAPTYADYDPPLIRHDFSLLYQSFLI